MNHYVCVTGGRDFDDHERVHEMLRVMQLVYGDTLRVMHGGATGADHAAGLASEELGITWRAYPADWEGECGPACERGHRRQRRGGGTYCPAAGNYRNAHMIRLLCKWRAEGHSVEVLAFPGGSGTADMVERAESAEMSISRG